jgi:2-amino-4-hydroxy-6-hydroxymethyldihydropteridine diphosphokinase
VINTICYIGLGSNIGDSMSIINDATSLLGQLPKTKLVKSSSLYFSDPISDVKQNKYINAVAQLKTHLKPYELLLELQAIESAFYRQRVDEVKWGPRTLDLDIILFGNEQFKDSHLTIPHAEMHNRLFVLQPLFDISGEIYISGLGSLSYLIDNAPKYELHKLDA